ncbi:hypothetical protein MIR68_010222 [Amoeboaphelidium protococcarum]|nr:hypothetical protein MIR68_010222 [Amoeboaphelidium protococcarum]
MTFDILAEYKQVLREERLSHPIAAVKALLNSVQYIAYGDSEESSEGRRELTVSELTHQINIYINQLKLANSSMNSAAFLNRGGAQQSGVQRGEYPSIAVLAGIHIFTRMISQYSPSMVSSQVGASQSMNQSQLQLNAHESPADYIIRVGQRLVSVLEYQLPRLIKYAVPFIEEGMTILTFGYSRSVMAVLLKTKECVRFRVYCCESMPSATGVATVRELQQNGVTSRLITDTSVGYYMQNVDAVLVGAEAIVENGGLINSIGTYQIGLIAKVHKVPFYCVAESCKFVKCFPLDQFDIYPERSEVAEMEADHRGDQVGTSFSQEQVPVVDYTPPQYISMLFTDLGVLTPASASDEIIKMS